MSVVNILAVYPLSEICARLEMRYILFRDVHFLPRFGISPNARRTIVQGHTAESPDLNAFPVSQGVRHAIQDTVDGKLK